MAAAHTRDFKDHFSDRASGYAAHRPRYPAALFDYLADISPRRERAWDAGCGSGQLAVSLADVFESVIATDASIEQLTNAAPHPDVGYVNATAEASGLADRSIDLCTAAQAAHWFDLPGFYAEVRRVTRSASIIALVTYGVASLDDAAADRVLRHFYADVLSEFWPPERRHVESGYRTLPFAFDELEAPELELRATWNFADFVGYIETWSAVRALEEAGKRDALDEFRRDLGLVWDDGSTTRTVRWPLALRVGRA